MNDAQKTIHTENLTINNKKMKVEFRVIASGQSVLDACIYVNDKRYIKFNHCNFNTKIGRKHILENLTTELQHGAFKFFLPKLPKLY